MTLFSRRMPGQHSGRAEVRVVAIVGALVILLAGTYGLLARREPPPRPSPAPPVAPAPEPEVAKAPPPPEPAEQDLPATPEPLTDEDKLWVERAKRQIGSQLWRMERDAKEKAKLEAIAQESTEETVYNMLNELWDGENRHFLRGTEEYINFVRSQPRVAKLLEVAANGSPEERERLCSLLVQQCECILADLPSAPETEEAYSPTAMDPFGGSAYPLVLVALDVSPDTLSLLLDLSEALQQGHAQLKGMEWTPDTPYVGSAYGLTLSYACEQAMLHYLDDENLGAGLTAEQAEILSEFAVYERQRKVAQESGRVVAFSGGEVQVFHYTRRFVHAALAH